MDAIKKFMGLSVEKPETALHYQDIDNDLSIYDQTSPLLNPIEALSENTRRREEVEIELEDFTNPFAFSSETEEIPRRPDNPFSRFFRNLARNQNGNEEACSLLSNDAIPAEGDAEEGTSRVPESTVFVTPQLLSQNDSETNEKEEAFIARLQLP